MCKITTGISANVRKVSSLVSTRTHLWRVHSLVSISTVPKMGSQDYLQLAEVKGYIFFLNLRGTARSSTMHSITKQTFSIEYNRISWHVGTLLPNSRASFLCMFPKVYIAVVYGLFTVVANVQTFSSFP